MHKDSSLPLSVRTTGDGSPTLFSEHYQQTYHSIHGSVTESNHIFLGETGIRDRLQSGLQTHVLEVGLGTGLNFLLTAQEAISSGASLDYWAMEHTILTPDTFDSLHLEPLINNHTLLTTFSSVLECLKNTADGAYSFDILDNVRLHILHGDASQYPIPNNQYNAVYQDAFSPDVNPELWSSLFFRQIYDTMHAGGRLTTFSVRRLVRENLKEAGFVVQKRPGPPGGKREMVLAIKSNDE